MPNFKPTLAATIERESQIQLPALASPKLDGIRALGTKTQLLSRTLKPIPNLTIQSAYKSALESHPQLAGLDGELVIGMLPDAPAYWLDEKGQLQSGLAGDYNSNQSVIMSSGKRPITATWVVFDRWANFEPDLEYTNSQTFEVRYQLLREELKRDVFSFSLGYSLELPQQPNRNSLASFDVLVLNQTLVHNLEELSQLEETFLSQGYEGVMLRHPKSPYKAGRSTIRQFYLAKLKRFEDSEATIVGFEERQSNQNEATLDARGYQVRSAHNANKVGLNTLGVLICEHPQFGQIRVGTGQGLDDNLRANIWNNQERYLGQLIKFKYQPVGTQDKPRIPIFLGFRDRSDM
jgi:DNA ligase-1